MAESLKGEIIAGYKLHVEQLSGIWYWNNGEENEFLCSCFWENIEAIMISEVDEEGNSFGVISIPFEDYTGDIEKDIQTFKDRIILYIKLRDLKTIFHYDKSLK